MRRPQINLVVSVAFGVVATTLGSPWYISNNVFTDVLGAPSSFTYYLIGGGDFVLQSNLVIAFVGGTWLWAALFYSFLTTVPRRHQNRLGENKLEFRTQKILPPRGRAFATAWIALSLFTLFAAFVISGFAWPGWQPIIRVVLAILVIRGSRIALLLFSGELIVSALLAFLPFLFGVTVMFNDPITDPIIYLISAAMLLSCWKHLSPSGNKADDWQIKK